MSRLLVAQRALTVPGWAKDDLSRKAQAIPSLDLRFADNKSLVDATTGSNLVTFTRASSGTFVGSDGVLRTAVTNLLLRSEELNETSWTKINCSISANAIAAPNGTLTADKVIENTEASVAHICLSASASVVSATVYTLSVFCKAAERSWVFVLGSGAPFGTNGIYVNLSTGATGYTAGSPGSVVVTPFGNGWYRISFSLTAGSSSATAGLQVRTATGDNSGVYTGDGTSGIYIWGAQLEQSSTVGEYIPTTSTINSAPRFDHNPTTGESLGLLVEEQRTNLLVRSVDYSTTWYTSAVTRTGNTTDVVAPDGQNTASEFVVATSGALGQGITSTAVTHTGSIYLRTDSGSTTVDLLIYRGSPFQLIQSATVTVTASWQRFTVTGTFLDTTTHNFQINFGSNKTVYVWGAQLEAGAFPTSYIPTTAAAATRSADVASITGTAFSSWYRQDEGTVFMGYLPIGLRTSYPLSIDDGTTSNFIGLGFDSSANRFGRIDTGGVTQVSITQGLATVGSESKAAMAVAANNVAASYNGAAPTADTSVTIPTVDRARLHALAGSTTFAFNGHIRRFCYWPQRLANSTLQTLTQ